MKRSEDARPQNSGLSRRHFLKASSLAPLAGLFGAKNMMATPIPSEKRPGRPRVDDPVRCGIIGYGPQGREIADTLTRMEAAEVTAICDNYDVMLRRAQRALPDASRHSDYREVLDNPDIQAVLVATPTHLHKDIVLDALEAGKNVYCEAPMASSIEDARAIALAARERPDQIFQVGQLFRSHPQHRSVFQFMRSGATGSPTMARQQWHSKQSWRQTSPNREREQAINWRLDDSVSTGLIGEAGLQQLDLAMWIYQEIPTAVTGFGQIMLWDDGRTVPDTIQAIFEFPNKTHLIYHASLATSFDAAYEMFHGSDSTIMLRDSSKAWMFKEVDAPMLGWEVYARKDKFFKENGIALLANATKLEAQNQDPTEDDPNMETALFYALQEFMDNHAFGPYPPNSNYEIGYTGAVVVIKANEAIRENKKIEYDPAWFDLG